MPRPVNLDQARQSDINQDPSTAVGRPPTPTPPGPPKRPAQPAHTPSAPAPLPASTTSREPVASKPAKRPSRPASGRRREVQVTVPTRIRDLADAMPDSRSDLVRLAYNEHHQQIKPSEVSMSRGPMKVDARRRRRSASETPLVPIMLRLTDDERDLLDDLASKAGLSRSAAVTQLLELHLDR